jgi:hypothetical protein
MAAINSNHRGRFQNRLLLNFDFFLELLRELTIHPNAKPNSVAMMIQSMI